jgi:hypothetical protein
LKVFAILSLDAFMIYDGSEPDWAGDCDEVLFRELDFPGQPMEGLNLRLDGEWFRIDRACYDMDKQRWEITIRDSLHPDSPEEFQQQVREFIALGWKEEPT